MRGGQPTLQDWDGKIYFSLPLPFPLDLADGCGVMPVGTPEPVAAERLQARFADKNDNAGLCQFSKRFTSHLLYSSHHFFIYKREASYA